MERIICLLIGYVCGLVQTGYFYGKLHGTDLRKHGSGNSGATNTLRVMGKKAGATVLAGDLLKCVVACVFVRLIWGAKAPEMELLYVLYAGLGVVLGHDYPFYLKFKGGKGIASTGGLVIALFDWRIFLVCLLVFLAIIFVTRYVSLGSMLGSVTFFLMWTGITLSGSNYLADAVRFESCAVVLVIALLAIIRHRSNIKRLLSGTENKLGAKK